MRRVVSTPNAPAPGGHFTQGIINNKILYTAGQIGQNIEKELQNETVETEVNQIMQNLVAVAEAAGTSLANTIKTTIYITDLAIFKAVNDTYKKYFPENPPGRSTVVVAGLAANARVEIEAIIAIDD